MSNRTAFLILFIYASVATLYRLADIPAVTLLLTSFLFNTALTVHIFRSCLAAVNTLGAGFAVLIMSFWLKLVPTDGPWMGTLIMLQLGLICLSQPGLKLGALLQMMILNLILSALYVRDSSPPAWIEAAVASFCGIAYLLVVAYFSAAWQNSLEPADEELR